MQVAQNAHAVLAAAVERIPKKWSNVQVCSSRTNVQAACACTQAVCMCMPVHMNHMLIHAVLYAHQCTHRRAQRAIRICISLMCQACYVLLLIGGQSPSFVHPCDWAPYLHTCTYAPCYLSPCLPPYLPPCSYVICITYHVMRAGCVLEECRQCGTAAVPDSA